MDNLRELQEEARTLERAGRDAAAVDLYGRILSDPEGAAIGGVWAARARLRLRAGAQVEAADDLAASAERYEAAGRRNLALAQWRASLRADASGPADRLLQYGRLAAELGYGRDARHGFAEYADRLEREGDIGAAIGALREYLAVVPDDAAVRRRLSELTGEPELPPPPAAAPAPDTPDEAPSSAQQGALPGLIPTAAEEGATEAVSDADEPPPVGLLEGFEPTDAGVPDDAAAHAAADDSPYAKGSEEAADDTAEAEQSAEPHSSASELPLLDASPTSIASGPGDRVAGEVEPEDAEVDEDEGEAVEPLPLLDVGEEPTPDTAPPAQEASFAAAAEQSAGAAAATWSPQEASDTARAPLELQRRRVEEALRAGDREELVEAYLGLAARLEAELRTEEARGAMARVLELDPGNERARAAFGSGPPASAGEEYVDFGAMVMADAPGDETRFQVAIGDPSGNEENDFAEILDLFRRNVSERLDPRDAASHYDLGLAFKQMGLLDDAIIHLQSGLRGGADPLATLEVLGECFVLRGQTSLAARVFDRATRLEGVGEAELVGVLYGLARCQEEMGDGEAARATLERVVAVDLSFRDAAERLRRLQSG